MEAIRSRVAVGTVVDEIECVYADQLTEIVQVALLKRSVSLQDAAKVASALVETSLRGVDTHGIRLLPIYTNLLDLGKAKAQPKPSYTQLGKAVGHLNADCALGPVTATDATQEAIKLAKECGVGAVAVSSANHFGSAGHYALMMADAQCLGLVFSNADALVAPHAGKLPFFGTNPIAVAAPGAGDLAFCLDMATSQVAFSRVAEHKETGTPLEPGWALDSAGQETLDGSASAALLPLGGYKGQGLAMAVQILCTLLSGADFDHMLAHALQGDPAEHQSIGHLFLCLDIQPFVSVPVFHDRLRALIGALVREEGRGIEPVRYAGQNEAECKKARLQNGIPVPRQLLTSLRALG